MDRHHKKSIAWLSATASQTATATARGRHNRNKKLLNGFFFFGITTSSALPNVWKDSSSALPNVWKVQSQKDSEVQSRATKPCKIPSEEKVSSIKDDILSQEFLNLRQKEQDIGNLLKLKNADQIAPILEGVAEVFKTFQHDGKTDVMFTSGLASNSSTTNRKHFDYDSYLIAHAGGLKTISGVESKHLHGDDQRKAGGVLLGLLPKLLYYVYEAEMKFAEVGNRQRQFFTRVNFWVSPLVRTMETLALILFVLISQVQDIIDFLDNEDENNHVNLGKTNRSGNSIKDSIATIGGQFALISEESDSGSGEDDSRNMQPSQISRMQASQILVTKALGTLNQYLMEARFEIHMHLEQVSIGFANKSRFFGQGRNPFTEGNLLEGGNLLDGVGLVQEEGVVQEEGGVQEQHIVKGSSGEWFAVAWPSSSVRRGPKEPGFFESLNSATTWLKTMKAQTDEVKEYQNLTKNTTNNKTTKTEPKDLPPSLPHPANLINAGKNPKKFIRDLETAIATQNAGLVIVSTDSVWLQVLAEFVDMKSNWRAEFMSMSSSSNDEESTDAAGSNDAAESSSPGPVMRPNPNLLKHNENPQKDEKKKPCYLDHERKLKNFGVVYMTDVTVWVSESDVSDLSKVNVKEMRVLSPGIQEKEDEEEEKQHTEQSGKEDIQKEQSWKEYSQQHKDSWKEYFEQHKDLWKEYSQHKYEYQESWKEYSQHKNAELYPDNICCCLSCFLLFLFCLCLCWLKPCQLQITDNLLDKTSGVPEARLKLASENHTPLPDASSRI